ncbi:MAG: hypothetical protein QM755_06660, partial [Luteolibacter sp.]
MVAGRYLFLIPEGDRAQRVKLLDAFVANPEFVNQINDGVRRLEEKKNHGKAAYVFFDSLGSWLGNADPVELAKSDLGWISYFVKEFFDGDFDPEETPSLLEEGKSRPTNDKGVKKWQSDIGHSLALAMLRQPAIAEEGFRLLTACKVWSVPSEEADIQARAALDGLIGARSKSDGGNAIFNGSGDPFDSSGSALDEQSSIHWLLSRLTAGVPADEVLPEAFVTSLQQKNPRLGGMVASLKGM